VKLGYHAFAVGTPREALDLFEKNPGNFDIVLTDLTMPDILGTQLAERIKTIRPDIQSYL